MNRLMHTAALFAIVTLAGAEPAAAQIRASERATFSQVVDGTRVEIDYARPRARGRERIFGGVVHWGEVWTPGANWATTLNASKAIKLDGHDVPAGKYSVWIVVRENGPWTMVLDPDHYRFHMDPPDSAATQIRFPVTAEDGPETDILTWSMPALRVNGGTLALQWSTKRVAMNLEVQPSLTITLPAAEARPYIGTYDFRYHDPDWGDTTKVIVFNVLHENGTLKAEWEPADDYMGRFALIRVSPHWFVPGLYDKQGQIYEVLRPEMVVLFEVVNGQAASIELRGEDDGLVATAKRRR